MTTTTTFKFHKCVSRLGSTVTLSLRVPTRAAQSKAAAPSRSAQSSKAQLKPYSYTLPHPEHISQHQHEGFGFRVFIILKSRTHTGGSGCGVEGERREIDEIVSLGRERGLDTFFSNIKPKALYLQIQ